MRVAIVHDYLTQRGGAERVVLALHRLFPDASGRASSSGCPGGAGPTARCFRRIRSSSGG